jgi:hypothetical protein
LELLDVYCRIQFCVPTPQWKIGNVLQVCFIALWQ